MKRIVKELKDAKVAGDASITFFCGSGKVYEVRMEPRGWGNGIDLRATFYDRQEMQQELLKPLCVKPLRDGQMDEMPIEPEKSSGHTIR